MKTTILILAALGLAAASSIAVAGTDTPAIDLREDRQSTRIIQGIHSGQLTRYETGRLVTQQRNVSRLEGAFRADGKVTRGERHILHAQLNRSSQSIYWRKHNNLRR